MRKYRPLLPREHRQFCSHGCPTYGCLLTSFHQDSNVHFHNDGEHFSVVSNVVECSATICNYMHCNYINPDQFESASFSSTFWPSIHTQTKKVQIVLFPFVSVFVSFQSTLSIQSERRLCIRLHALYSVPAPISTEMLIIVAKTTSHTSGHFFFFPPTFLALLVMSWQLISRINHLCSAILC